MTKTTTALIIIATSSLLMACSKGDTLVLEKRLGPVTKQQLRTLPNTLEGDTEGARHTSYTLEGKGMKDAEGNIVKDAEDNID